MLRVIAATLALLAAPAFAAGGTLRAPVKVPEHLLWSRHLNAAANGATSLGGHILPAQPATVSAVSVHVVSASGGGAGNTVITITDGTNTCTATFSCVGTGSGTPKSLRVDTVSVAGTGCLYAPSASISASITTAGCTTTQPSFLNVEFLGKWR